MQGRLIAAAAVATQLVGCATSAPHWDDPSLNSITRDSLVPFTSREEFDAYFKEAVDAAEKYDMWWAQVRAKPVDVLMAQTGDTLPCDPAYGECVGELEEVMTTGSRLQRTSVTNNQEVGVDEGDIVKHYENFLIVLQDGRLFSVSIGESVSELALVDRIEIYASPDERVWYDELLISGNKLIVTGFNYREDVTDISVFQIDDDGVFEWLSAYEISSGDYYSGENYATRMVNDHLVIYTPIYLSDYGPDEGVVFPVYRQRTRDGTAESWQPLFAATDLHWPIQATLDPVVHSVSVCPITAEDGFSCRSIGVLGPQRSEWYVSSEYAFLWVSQSDWELWDYYDAPDCGPDIAQRHNDTWPSTVYRVPLSDGPVTAVRAQGAPGDQFGLDARDDRLLALLASEPWSCYFDWEYKMPMRLAQIPAGAFAVTPEALEPAAYADLLPLKDWRWENRFTDGHVVYSDESNVAPEGAYWETAILNVVPLDNPDRNDRVALGHSVERLEVLGDGLIAAGHLYKDGLHLSSISLNNRPALVDTHFLYGYFESEGRSHAFNWHLEEDNSGVFGLPVTIEETKSWNTASWLGKRDRADLGFFEVSADMQFSLAGILESTEPDDAGYECVVSCTDWYGNARPIFLNGRVFGLSGTELMEGQIANGVLESLGRVHLTGQPLNER